jgi:hypothetical protein
MAAKAYDFYSDALGYSEDNKKIQSKHLADSKCKVYLSYRKTSFTKR